VDLGKSQGPNPAQEAPEDYCRAVEAYLCRKNDGHLVRIVGPSFEMVCGWAARGVPITVAQRGIDRYFERYYANGPRRRPVRIDFCEADVLDLFDDWRRAVGVGLASEVGADLSASAEASADKQPRAGSVRHTSLPAHLERVVARLTAMRAGDSAFADATADKPAMAAVVNAIVPELDAARAGAKGLRGHARAGLLQRLVELDAHLLAAARDRLSDSDRTGLRREAEAELASFRGRMPHAAFEQSIAACVDRLLRDRFRIPTLSLE
jgi:hypothetical protein